MKIGIVINTNEPEVVWNAFRFCNLALKENNEVKIFLINKGVEINNIKDEKYNIKEQINSFVNNRGCILACETCLRARQKENINFCPISTMRDLLRIVEESDKVLTFS